MTGARIKKYLEDRRLSLVETNYPGITLYKYEAEKAVSLVLIIEKEAINTLDNSKLAQIEGRIIAAFTKAGFTASLLGLFISNDIETIRRIAGETPYWIVDAVYGRVIVYDNQPENFLSMRRDLEGIISFLKADELKREQAARGQEIKTEGAYKSREEQWTVPSGKNKRVDRNGNLVYKRPLSNYPYVIFTIIAINVAVLIIVNLLGEVLGTAKWDSLGSTSWMKVFEGHEFYRLITSMFLHADIGHISGNMVMLYAVGDLLEGSIGHLKMALIYLFGGIIASCGSAYYYYVNHEYVQSIGASGAVFAVVGGLLACLYLNRERMKFSSIGFGRIALLAAYSLYSGMGNDGIDNAAHVAGFLGGILIYLIIWTFFDSKKKPADKVY